MNFISTKNIGLNKDQIVHIPLYQTQTKEQIRLMKQSFSSLSGVQSVSANRFKPGAVNWNQTVWWEGQVEEESMFIISVDKDFFKTFDVELLEGDLNFITQEENDNHTYILNEAAKKHIGWDKAVGKKFNSFGEGSQRLITGVIKDFNFQSLHNLVKPCVIVVGKFTPTEMHVKLATNDFNKSLVALKQKFSELNPGIPFEYTFIDKSFEQLYEEETRAGTIVSFFQSNFHFISLIRFIWFIVI